MKHYRKRRRGLLRDLAYKALIFLGTVAVITYFLPRGKRFNYQFEVNKPWRYGQLMATFDFPIYKSDEVVAHEHDSILARLLPYYQLASEAGGEAARRMQDDYTAGRLTALPSADYVRHLVALLEQIYSAGILPSEQLAQLKADSTTAIMVIDGVEAVQRPLSALFSVKEAYTYMLEADTLNYHPQVLRQCALNEYLSPNLTYDQQRTEAARAEALDNYSWANGLVQAGQKIIDRGEIVTRETYNILLSLRRESLERGGGSGQDRLLLAGQALFVAIFVLCFMLYLDLFRHDFYNRRGSLTLLLVCIMAFCVTTALLVRGGGEAYVYVVPYAMLPVIIRVFLDSRTSFFAHVITIMVCSVCLDYPHEFILLQLSAGAMAIFSLKELSQRSQLFKTALLVIVTYAAVFLAYELIQENDLTKLDGTMYVRFLINGLLLLFTYPLMFVVEKVFGFTSNVTLVELSNINTPLLRRLSETVPGTFQHSMQVANLAAEAANRIGAKSQLVRTGALYHDIGKMARPAFFTENQSAGINPHTRLSYEQSAQVVISHVTEGLKLAEKYNLPKAVTDFISTHHGLGTTRYFYISWKNDHPGEEPDMSLFTYPGPNPSTQEQAILMMADAVEAASRSLPAYTEETIGNLVDKIIDGQLAEGYFRDCPITFHDIATVKATFKEKLKTIYHTRISYPELKR